MLLTIALFPFLCSGAAAQQEPTLVVLVRHAEAAAQPADDPGLTPEGTARAQALIGAVDGVAAVYTTQYLRTRATAEPLARAQGVEITVVEYPSNPMGGGGAASTYAHALAERIREEHGGQTVVVVGHSNTIPPMVEALGAPSPGTIEHDRYDNLFIVVLPPGGPARLVRAKYGERS